MDPGLREIDLFFLCIISAVPLCQEFAKGTHSQQCRRQPSTCPLGAVAQSYEAGEGIPVPLSGS